MTTRGLLQELADKGVVIQANGERLRVDAPTGALTDELRRELTARKTAVLALLARARVETVRCGGDDCEGMLTLTHGVGVCSTCGLPQDHYGVQRQGPCGPYTAPEDWIN